jgi:Transcription factor WhiB
VESLTWMDDAVCRGLPVEWFFPERGDHESRILGQMCCEECPVQERCYDFGLAHEEQVGIWGGTSAKERQEIVGRRFAIHGQYVHDEAIDPREWEPPRTTSHGFTPALADLSVLRGASRYDGWWNALPRTESVFS